MSKLDDIAAALSAHFKVWEADKEWNTVLWVDNQGVKRTTSRMYMAHAYRAGSYVGISYVSYQGNHNLKAAEAIEYLQWIEAGNRGTHWTFERERRDAE